NSDQSSTIINSNTVTTHTIGFNIDDPYLSDVASNGGGGYYTASSSADLLAAFQEILRTTLNIDTTFVSPGVTVNSFNRLTHRNEIYFSLFQPQETPHWPGNLKRYKITSSGSILDANDVDAIDASTCYFKDDAVSYWDTIQDGNDTAEGGAARQLPSYSARNLYTYYSGSSSTNLNNSANHISITNKANISKSMLSIDGESDAYHENLINWVRGKDVNDADDDNVTDEDRDQLSDPLHSAPYLVIYGGTDDDPDITVFYGDNEGMLHAIDASDGEEIFAFAPEEVLSNFDTLYKNSGADDHPYGLDGPVTAWVKDGNANSIIESDEDDHVYVYVGMRRGGRNYYALDVTDRNSPKFLWKITGGSGDFTNMGQSWARPIKTKINVSGTSREVLIISGGYDDAQDSVNIRTPDSIGNSIYIVDAEDGSLIWKAGDGGTYDLNLGDMDYSIPATVRAIDTNSDGYADQMYVGDMGGQLWRFDIRNGNAASSLVTGAVIADLGGATTATARRFYHEPDVSQTVKNSQQQLTVAIGSGYQAHPLSTEVEDRFFVIHQTDTNSAPADSNLDGSPDYVTLVESDLYDATDNTIENGTDAQKTAAISALAAASGWFIEMEGELSDGSNDPGEKILSRALTFGGVVYFSSYQPSATVSADCTIAPGLSKLYAVNITNGTPAGIIDSSTGTNNDGTDASDRFSTLLTSGLPPDPVHLRISNDSGSGVTNLISVGTEIFTAGERELTTKTHWYTE
ncbi:MAG: pilus assembly protein PilY, partial [Pseudomonadales bacterium]|nr:pilus assembly protein PilY [Pseudomonadales bacterium]